jgi:hypothetical protein
MLFRTATGCKVRLRLFGLGAGALAGLTISIAAAAAVSSEPTQLAKLSASSNVQATVAAVAGWTAWSDLENGQYKLKLLSPAGVLSSPAAVPPSVVPFRVALGKRSSGAIVAAYDVCPQAKAPAAGAIAAIGPACRIMLLDVARGTVRRLALATHTTSNALPVLSGDRLAFVAVRRGNKTSARIMTEKLGSASARTRWSAKVGHGSGPVQIAVSGNAVAAIWAQSGNSEQRLDAQSAPGAKVRRLGVAGSDFSCCEADRYASLAFLDSRTVSVLDVSGDDEGNAEWRVDRMALGGGKKPAAGPKDEASGSAADGLLALSLAEDGKRDIVLTADSTHPFGVYAFTS